MDTFCTTFSLFEQRFVPIKCQTSEKKTTKTTKLTYMNYGEVSMYEICSVILSGVSNFLTVWRFDCCRRLDFAPLVWIYFFFFFFFGFLFFHSALLCMSSFSIMSFPWFHSDRRAGSCPSPFKTVCILRRPEVRLCVFFFVCLFVWLLFF